MDDTAVIRHFVETFQGIGLDQYHGWLVASIARDVNELVRDTAAGEMGFESEASTFLSALEAEDGTAHDR